jgi:hypothetical protein
METASKALKANITELGPLVLPLSEKLIFVGNLFARKARPPGRLAPAAWRRCSAVGRAALLQRACVTRAAAAASRPPRNCDLRS